MILEGIRFPHLFYGFLMYALGICIADYLNIQVDWINVFFGYLIILLMQFVEGLIGLTRRTPEINRERQVITKKQALLAVIAIMMMALAFLLVLLFIRGVLTGARWLFLLIIGLICILRPNIILRNKLVVFHEVIDAVLIVGIIPSFAFNLISSELHPFLILINLPLFFIFLGTQIALAFPQYSKELTKYPPSLLVQIGWQRGISLHDILVIIGFLNLAVSGLIGFPWVLLWPTMVVSLIGIMEIIQLHRIGEGEKPNWKLLKLVAHGLFGLSIYTMIFSLLIN